MPPLSTATDREAGRDLSGGRDAGRGSPLSDLERGLAAQRSAESGPELPGASRDRCNPTTLLEGGLPERRASRRGRERPHRSLLRPKRTQAAGDTLATGGSRRDAGVVVRSPKAREHPPRVRRFSVDEQGDRRSAFDETRTYEERDFGRAEETQFGRRRRPVDVLDAT